MIRKLLYMFFVMSFVVAPERPALVTPIFSAHYTNFDDGALIGGVARISGARTLTSPVQRTLMVFKNAAGDVATITIEDSTKFQAVVSAMQKGGYELVDYSQGLSVTGK